MPENSNRIGAVSDLYCRPLVYGIKHASGPASAGLSFDSPGVNAERLLGDELDAAFIGPIDHARNSSDFSLYRSIGLSSRNESRSIILCVNRDIGKIASVAVGVVSSSDIVLGKIILSEQFEQEIAIVPVIGTVDQMLTKADAALLTGNSVLTSDWKGPRLDLVDEWTDMTDLPYVHLLCASRKEKERKDIEALLTSSKEKGIASFGEIASLASKDLGVEAEVLEQQLELYSYSFDKDDRQGLAEFYRYAFYLGIIPDMPEIDVFEGE